MQCIQVYTYITNVLQMVLPIHEHMFISVPVPLIDLIIAMVTER